MIDWLIVISAATGVLILIAIVILRIKADVTVEALTREEVGHDDPNVEYQWTTEPQGLGRILLIIFFVAGAIFSFFSFDFTREFISHLSQAFIVFLGLASALFKGIWKKTEYKITDVGLMKKEVNSKAAKKKSELVFAWRQLAWIKAKNHGFRYYLRRLPPMENLTGVKQIVGGGSGYINAGKNAMVVNALIMSRGIPSSPPVNPQ